MGRTAPQARQKTALLGNNNQSKAKSLSCSPAEILLERIQALATVTDQSRHHCVEHTCLATVREFRAWLDRSDRLNLPGIGRFQRSLPASASSTTYKD